MKKVFAIILSAMIVMSFAACGNSNSGTDSKTEGTSSVASTESSKVESSQSKSKNESSNTSNTESSVLSTALEKVKAEVELPSDMADFDERRLKRVFGITDEQAEDFSGAICTDGLRQDEFIYVKFDNTTSGLIEFHVWDSSLKNWVRHTASNYPESGYVIGSNDIVAADLQGRGKDTIYYVKYRGTTNNTVEVHGWGDGQQSWASHISTSSGIY